jgi:ribosomal protein S18 acetylase RimI-like enzyme
MLIEILKPKAVNVLELVRFTMEAESHLPEQLRCANTEKEVERYIRDAFDVEYYFILARLNGRLVGWAGLYAITASMVHFDPWHPLVIPEDDSDSVFRSLVEASIKHVKAIGRDRLEVFLMNLTDDIRETYDYYRPLYESAGMRRGNEWIQMIMNPTASDLALPNIPSGYSLKRIIEGSNEDIWPCYNATFLASGDRRYLNQTEIQRKESFEDFFSREKPIDSEASLLLYYEEQIVGFMKINIIREGGFVNGIGIRPDFRRKGLARLLMTASIFHAAQNGMNNLILEVDIENKQAIALYEKIGFRKVGGSISHVWTK